MFDIPNWPQYGTAWSQQNLNFLSSIATYKQEWATLETITNKSDAFPISFPVETVRCKNLPSSISKKTLEQNINSAYPILHECILTLLISFLHQKRKFGSDVEREFYKDLSFFDFIERLISKRAVAFLTESDHYLLLDGTKGFGNWETIGTNKETEKLNLKNCLSYDEVKLAAFLSVSSFTTFINDGNRYNNGARNTLNVEPEGIIIGLIGARFEKPRVMEYEEIVKTEDQNQPGNGYGRPFVPTMKTMMAGFYGEASSDYSEILQVRNQQKSRYFEVRDGIFFDNTVYCKRLALSFDTLLIEANHRAKEKNTFAFVHVVGIGLGVWKYSSHQTSLFLDTFAARLR